LRKKDKIERKQKKLLEAHYADAILLTLFKQEQDQLAAALLAIDRQLAAHDTPFGAVKRKLSKALAIMENCGAMYTGAPEHIKRAYNQAFFEKIYVWPTDDGSCEVKPQFAEPYGLIFGQESKAAAANEAEEAETRPEMENPANLRGLDELSRRFAEWRNRRIFFGGGFSNRLLPTY
jgi:hypothetical protein